LSGTELGPPADFLAETKAAHHIPLHFNFTILVPDVDIDRWFGRFKIRGRGEVGLLMLMLNRIVGGAAIDVLAIDTDTHGSNPLTNWYAMA
jgi:hypothetical protein